MKKNRSAIRIPMPLRYVINLILIVAVWFVLNSLIQSGVITNYWSGILITVGINIILATSLNVATGYLGQLPLGHAGFMAVGAYAGGIFMKAMPVQELLKSGNTGAAIPYILLALLISAIVAGTFGIIIGIPALRLRGDYLAIITLGFGEIIRVILTNIDSVIGTDFTYGAAGLKRIPKYSSFTLVFICVVVCCYVLQDVCFRPVRHDGRYRRLPVRGLSRLFVSVDLQVHEVHRDPRHGRARRHGLDARLDPLGHSPDHPTGAAAFVL